MKKLIYCLCFFMPLMTVLNSQTPNALTAKEKKEGWILLFDGKTTAGWTTNQGQPVPSGWEIKDGCLNEVKDGKGGDIITAGEYSDFEFSVDYKIEKGCNSGIKYFFTKYDQGGYLGMEYQIIDDINGEDTKQENHLCGSFYDVLPANAAMKKVNAPGNWNTIKIVAMGKKVEHWMNGINILTFERGSKQVNDAIALSKFSKTKPAFGTVDKGHIQLQEHGGVISFRNIKIKVLK